MTTHPTDIKAGAYLRKKRIEGGYNQETLSQHIGVSFQQLQKYEKGINRISMSKWYEAMTFLGIAPGKAMDEALERDNEQPLEDAYMPATLFDHYRKLPDHLQRVVWKLVKEIGEEVTDRGQS